MSMVERLRAFEDMVSGPSGELLFTSKELSWLGGKKAAADTLREHSLYASIEFRANWNKKIPSGFYFPDPVVQQDYTRTWNGDFSAEYQMSASKPLKLCLTVYLQEDTLNVMQVKTVLNGTQNIDVDCDFSGDFKENTSQTMQLALAYQVLHQFLRQHASILQDDELEQLTEHLHAVYLEQYKKPYLQVLDLVMARLDTTLARENTVVVDSRRRIGSMYLEPAQMLQASGKYALAGQLYALMGDMFANKDSASFYVDAAQAFKQGKQYAEAESFYLKAHCKNMGFRGRGVVFAGDIVTNGANSGLLDNYSEWHGKVKSGPDGDNEKSQISLVYHTYIGLLLICKYQAYQGQNDRKAIERFNTKMLQGKFKKVKGANQAADALSSGNADDFRAKILACLKSPMESYVPVKSLGACEEGVEGKKRHIRNFLGRYAASSRCSCCGAPAMQQQALKTCPCLTEKYCRKECQVAHWKQHKRFCAFHQKKKERTVASG